MCFFYSMICDCAPHHIVVCSRCCCRHQCIPRSVVAVVLAPSCIDAPSDNDDNDGDTAGQVSSLLVAAAAIADESPGSPPCRAVVPTCLRRLCLCCHPPPKTPLPKLTERDLQEIVRAPFLPRPHPRRRHPPSQRRCRLCPPSPHLQ